MARPKPHPGNETKPVTYIGLDEARAYCTSLGKRLPREEEWQFSGQGPNSTQRFPWGLLANASLMPKQVAGAAIPGPQAVGSYSPAGETPSPGRHCHSILFLFAIDCVPFLRELHSKQS